MRVLILLLITSLVACSPLLSNVREMSDLEVGMTSKEVISIWGEPTNITDNFQSGMETWSYREGFIYYSLYFLNGILNARQRSEVNKGDKS